MFRKGGIVGRREGVNRSSFAAPVFRAAERLGASPKIGYLFGLAAGVCYGVWGVIAKTALSNYDIPPLLFAAAAFAFGTAMFTPVLAYGIPKAVNASKSALALFAVSGLASGVAIVALSFAVDSGDITVVTPIVAVNPLIVLLLVRIFMERLEKVSLPLVMGCLLVVGGTIMVVVGDSAF